MRSGSPPTSDKWSLGDRSSLLLALILFLGVFVFFWNPIRNFGSTIYSSGDLSQRFPLLRVSDDAARPKNELLSDPVTEMEPWLEFNRVELLQGQLPLLNPYNGSGVPHLANAQSAVLSPFSLPHYFLPKEIAYLLSAMLKLLVAGGFMLFYLRQLGLSPWAALLGALGYAYCGHNLLLLSYPHVGAAALLPAMLYFTERVLNRHEQEGSVDRPGLAGLALSYGLCALSGQPEPLFFGGLISAVYLTWRISSRVLRSDDRQREWAISRPLCLGLGAAILISMLISAIGLLPFVEYMQHSRLAEQRDGTQTPLPRALWPLYAYPNLLGNPSNEYYLHAGVPPINYEAANSAYIGALMLFMALVSLAVTGGRRVHTFFGAVLLLWVLWAHDFWGLNRWIAHLPLIGIAPINRSQFVFALASSICAAFLLDRLASLRQEQRKRFALGILLAAALSMAWFHAGTQDLIERSITFVQRLPNRTSFPLERLPQEAWSHVREMNLCFVLGAVALVIVALSSRAWVRALGSAIVLAVCFVQTGWLLRDYNPTIPIEQHMPKTRLIEQLAGAVGTETLAIVGTEALPPSMNMPYGIHQLANYDGLWVGPYDALYRSRFGTESNWRLMNRADGRSLALFGAQYVLTLPEWSPIDTLFPLVPWNPRTLMDIPPVRPGVDLAQTFTVPAGELRAVSVWADLRKGTPKGVWAMRVRDLGTSELFAELTFGSKDLVPNPEGFARIYVEFPPVPNSQGRLMRVRFECMQLEEGEGLRIACREDMPDWQNQLLHDTSRRWNRESRKLPPPALTNPANAHPELAKWKLMSGKEQYSGGMALDLRVASLDMQDAGRIGPYQLLRLPSVKRYSMVTHAIFVADRKAARLELDHPSFDPATSVILEGGPENVRQSTPGQGSVEVVEEKSRGATLRTHSDREGWLVTNKPFVPGWRALVDGSETEVVCANEAFVAVPVGAGVREVRLEYKPRSASAGLWLSVLGVLGLVLLWRGRQSPIP